ncbi:hypothetical protein M407DRAFT_26641 [Tulasnella calospora MUT 4182]|uniref:DUF6533 domain-containing protein n=1 Tax=Tulasnella calospora MUT 4182 TaxID=1051891 RepID=A0A0C3LRB9_9AGAM|nr:hypothetical protein M407DRAFT_26641 [Tulasnella calospora MUT 4182]
MTSIPDMDGATEQLLYQQSGYWLAAGGATLLIYDWVLCLDREVQYVWKARWSFGKMWFICHRYAMMALAIAIVYVSVKTSDESSAPEWCKMWDNLSNVGTIRNFNLSRVLLGTFALRVCALYHNSPYIIAFVGATYISCNVLVLVFFAKLRKAIHYLPNPLTPYCVCVRTCDNCMRWCIYLYIPLMLLDFVILLLTLRQSFVTKSQRNAAPILDTLFRDGILYFVVAFATGLVNILFNVFAPWAAKTWMAK